MPPWWRPWPWALLPLLLLLLAGAAARAPPPPATPLRVQERPVYRLRQLLPSSDAADVCLAVQGMRLFARREACALDTPSQEFFYDADNAAFVGAEEGLCLDAMYKNRRNRGLGTWPCHYEPNQQFPCQGPRCCCAEEGLTDWCVLRLPAAPSSAAAAVAAAVSTGHPLAKVSPDPPPPPPPPLLVPTVADGPPEAPDGPGHPPLVALTVVAVLSIGLFGAWFIMKTLLDDDFESDAG